MMRVTDFDDQIPILLPITYTLLKSANLIVHNQVTQITLHGSRGPAGCYRPDSDMDLSLIVDTGNCTRVPELESLLQSILSTTLSNWQSDIELDLAIIFDVRGCGLKCFNQIAFDAQFCPLGGIDCFGLYKKQKGFNGLVTDAGVKVRLMYPCITIWKKP